MTSTIRHQYFVAIIPPDDIIAEIQAFKERVAEKYHSQAALKSTVHITLIPPLMVDAGLEKKYIHLLDDVASRHHTFDVHLNGFGSFPPRVIYVKPEKELRMNVLSREIANEFLHHITPAMELRTFKFKAHMTIAYRDLDPADFVAAWSEFKKKLYQRSFHVKDVCLMRHDSKKWNVIHRSSLHQQKSDVGSESLDLFT